MEKRREREKFAGKKKESSTWQLSVKNGHLSSSSATTELNEGGVAWRSLPMHIFASSMQWRRLASLTSRAPLVCIHFPSFFISFEKGRDAESSSSLPPFQRARKGGERENERKQEKNELETSGIWISGRIPRHHLMNPKSDNFCIVRSKSFHFDKSNYTKSIFCNSFFRSCNYKLLK